MATEARSSGLRRAAKRPPDSEVGLALRFALDHFSSTLEALRELLDVTAPHAAKLDTLDHRIQAAVANFSTPTRAEALTAAQAFDAANKKLRRSSRADEGPEVAAELAEASAVATREINKLVELFGGPQRAFAFVDLVAERHTQAPRLKILLRSLIPTAVGAFDVLVASLAKGFLRLHPKSLGSTDKEFSLDELVRFGSVEEAVRVAIDRRVDEFLRSGFDEWAQWFTRQLKRDVSSLVRDWDETREVFQRRHTIVHSGGKVTQQYLEKVRSRAAVGDELDVSQEYVAESINRLASFGILLGLATWAKLVPGQRDAYSRYMTEAVYNQMLAGRWQVVENVCRGGKTCGLDAAGAHVLQVNEWLATKRLGRMDVVRDEISGWDTSALSDVYTAAKYALLDQIDEAMPLVDRLAEFGDLSLTALKEWPLLLEMRQSGAFQQLIERETEKLVARPDQEESD